jgi:hypothetical protein
MNELEHTKSELKHLQELLLEYDQELRRKNELLTRCHKEPLSDDRLYQLFRHSMDWRVFARDLEKEHGIGEKETDFFD